MARKEAELTKVYPIRFKPEKYSEVEEYAAKSNKDVADFIRTATDKEIERMKKLEKKSSK